MTCDCEMPVEPPLLRATGIGLMDRSDPACVTLCSDHYEEFNDTAMDEYRANVETETFQRTQCLRELRMEHRDLDQLIQCLQEDPLTDELALRRLKKQKLRLKDLIAQTESALIPDLDA